MALADREFPPDRYTVPTALSPPKVAARGVRVFQDSAERSRSPRPRQDVHKPALSAMPHRVAQMPLGTNRLQHLPAWPPQLSLRARDRYGEGGLADTGTSHVIDVATAQARSPTKIPKKPAIPRHRRRFRQDGKFGKVRKCFADPRLVEGHRHPRVHRPRSLCPFFGPGGPRCQSNVLIVLTSPGRRASGS